ncbi:iron uptake transporter deferrochelatase/peroxidase subunit [Bacillus sp. S/N-304-OC-R1]|uniref:iron uptake transporter deferrochelatase/peroxidase subunit n=1 Tax=Bacillus sp. S/N-304-OC-R1 TaxID=2758034 RepID=UPI001C8EA479|nr:iron uptake transporter deferrochelatase/peroxidase subunit [Bacillus sp. S/N-304-OC-R1]MBY0121341.1 deferrochelatase/peroxidase EfeB [Bacillus sp. S/N-304-OC-R1]
MKEELRTSILNKAVSRRNILKAAGIGGVGLVLGATGMGGVLTAIGANPFTDDNPTSKNKVNFYGSYQSGILTKNPKHVYFVALNCTASSKAELKELFKIWTEDSVRMMNGEMKLDSSNTLLPPLDTGEANGLDAANLTLTFGVGPSLFEKQEFGLHRKKPNELKDLPHFPKDQLDPAYTGGDFCIQACADDPQVAFHAVRNLIRSARGKVTMKWSQTGFNSYPQKNGKLETPRNLFAFKDGTGNPNVDDEKEMNEVVWVQPGESKDWLTGGTYLVARKIQMHLETWDRTALKEQEATFGRHRDTGAPIGKTNEFEDMDINRTDENGNSVVPATSHVYLARQVKDKILRRSFSYSNGVQQGTGAFDAGLLFISFQKSPKSFINIQNSFGRIDKLNEYISHRGSAIFACFPGVKKGSYLGSSLFD